MEHIKQYLQAVLDENAELTFFEGKEKLSIVLAGSYQFYWVRALETEFVLAKPWERMTIDKLKKQFIRIEEALQAPVALVEEELTPYRRKKLIQERVAFVSARHQMYLPFLGLHIQEKKSNDTKRYSEDRFSPATQAVYLAVLYHGQKEITQVELAQKLNLSVISVSRALDYLVKMHLLDYCVSGKTGRKKVYKCADKKQYYENGKEYLINPVKGICYVKSIPENVRIFKSGLSALGEKTMLADTDHSIFAIGQKDEQLLKDCQVSEEKGKEEHLPEIQIMKYDLEALSVDGYVDNITLIYSLEEKDERIEIAIEELMEGCTWYVE